MTEEINHAYDGGLYAELAQNRALLDDATRPAHWSVALHPGAAATIGLEHAAPLNAVLTNSLRLEVTAATSASRAGVANEGYWGIPVKPDTKYRASFYARGEAGFSGPIHVSIESEDGATIFAEGEAGPVGAEWKEHTLTLKTGKVAPTTKARLVLSLDRPGTVLFSFVSLFPPTWHNRANGNRVDLMQMLADLKPGFLRFPGGNFLEGDTVATRFDWKRTIGPLIERPGHAGPWGYRSTDGLGLLEFLDWCEDLEMEPVLAVYAGYNLRGTHIEAGPGLEPYVQEALEEIEYVTGSGATTWGARRARDGHPAPFKLTYVEIGNEDWFDKSGSYDARFAQFNDAIKAKYPGLKCISTVGNEQPEKLRVHSRRPDVVDEHYYTSAADFERDAPAHFEKYDKAGPEIFVGEWAAYEDIKPWEAPSQKLAPTPALKAALADAAWMAAMERHADLITMQCYAPLLVNVNPGARQWRPNLIGYDALRSFGSPSYYAIQMFSQNHGDTILKTSAARAGGLHYSATKDSKTGVVYLKIVNPEAKEEELKIALRGAAVEAEGELVTLSGSGPAESNSIDTPVEVVPVRTRIAGIKPEFARTFPGYSISVLRLRTR